MDPSPARCSSYVDHVVGSDGDEVCLLFANQRYFVRGIVTTGFTEWNVADETPALLLSDAAGPR